MKKQSSNAEMEMLKCITEKFTRHPDQLNRLSEADAEIISFKHRTSDFLILKIDGLYEELQQGLYEDPYLIGWMSITVTISDIAAVGANPFGVLMALQLPDTFLKDKRWYSFSNQVLMMPVLNMGYIFWVAILIVDLHYL